MGNTRFYKVTGSANVGGAYPLTNFSITAITNTFANASVTITSNEKDGGKFSKATAINMSKQMLRRVQNGSVTGGFNANSGAASISFNGFITGMSANANSQGSVMTVTARLISKDVQLTKFNPNCLLNLNEDGYAIVKQDVLKKANELKLDPSKLSALAILTAGDSSSGLAQSVSALIEKAIFYAESYGEEKSKDAIKDTIKFYKAYVKQFLKGSEKSSGFFGGQYTPEKGKELADINNYIADKLFTTSGFWTSMLQLMSYFQLCYSPNPTGGMGKINVQDYSPGGGASLPESMCFNISASGDIWNQKLPASNVYMPILVGSANSINRSQITVGYPSSASTDGPSVTLDSNQFFATALDGINLADAKAGQPQGRSFNSKGTTLTKVQKASKKKLANITKAATAVCRNAYYYLKYKQYTASANAYFEGLGGLEVGTKANAGGFSGVLNNISITGGSTSGISITANLEGVAVQ